MFTILLDIPGLPGSAPSHLEEVRDAGKSLALPRGTPLNPERDFFIVLSFYAKRKYERKGAKKEKLMALLPTGPPEPGPKALNFTPFLGLPSRR
jgi:hypothetical protein